MRNDNEIRIEVKCEEGICPICGGPLGYSDNANMIEEYLPWVCLDCDATGKEGFCHKDPAPSDGTEWKDYVEFDGHFDVCLKDGTPVKLAAPSTDAKKEQITVETKCEEGLCPICGGELHFAGCREDDDNGCTYPWNCSVCGASGKESYSLSFDGSHYDVETKNGTPVKLVAPSVKAEETNDTEAPTEEVVCPVCGGELHYTGETGETRYGICQQWKCTQCGSIGWAKFEEETNHYFTGEHEDVQLADGSEWDGNAISTPTVPAEMMPTNAVKGWFIPVTWEMYGVVRIPFEKAATLAEAMKCAREDMDIALPKGHYVDGSFAPSFEDAQVEEIRALYNDNRPDPEVVV